MSEVVVEVEVLNTDTLLYCVDTAKRTSSGREALAKHRKDSVHWNRSSFFHACAVQQNFDKRDNFDLQLQDYMNDFAHPTACRVSTYLVAYPHARDKDNNARE